MSKFASLLQQGRPLIMGVLNVTPDSFSDGGQFFSTDSAVAHAGRMLNEGADLIDVGGESTRPGSNPVSAQQELDRVVPVLEAIREAFPQAVLSLDSSTPEVMATALDLDIDLINDVRALRRGNALSVAAQANVPVCLMHMKGDPQTMQMNPEYDDVIAEINAFFKERVSACVAAGLDRGNIILDPGFGFGKLPHHNFQLLNRLQEFSIHGLPLLMGLSRKSTIGRVTDLKLIGSLSGAVIAAANGAKILRVHDVAETVSAISIFNAVRSESREFD